MEAFDQNAALLCVARLWKNDGQERKWILRTGAVALDVSLDWLGGKDRVEGLSKAPACVVQAVYSSCRADCPVGTAILATVSLRAEANRRALWEGTSAKDRFQLALSGCIGTL